MVGSDTHEFNNCRKDITELRKLFATHGLPTQVLTDNGPQFTSQELEVFLKGNGIQHYRSVPYYPATNGEAERYQCSNIQTSNESC